MLNIPAFVRLFRLAACILVLPLLFASASISGPAVAAQATPATFIYDETVTQADRVLIEEGIRFAQEYFFEHFSMPADESLTVSVLDAADPTDESVLAYQIGRAIVIYAGSEGWHYNSPALRLQTVLHEFTHFYQYIVGGDRSDYAAWFEEGLAEYIATTSLAAAGILEKAEFDAFTALQMVDGPATIDLATMEDHDAFGQAGAIVYAYAYFAVEHLFADVSVATVPDYYAAMNRGESFGNAFQQSFGVPVADFYAGFATVAEAARLQHDLPAAYFPIESYTSEYPVQWVKRFPFVTAGDQTIIHALTGEGALCSLQISFNGSRDQLSRTGYSDGAGDVFWLVSIPSAAPNGEASISVDCGEMPFEAPIVIEAA